MSTKRISIVDFLSRQSVAGAEVLDGGQHFPLEAFAPLEFGFLFTKVEIKDYRTAMEAAGFKDITITPSYFNEATIDEAVRDMGRQVDLKGFSRTAISKTVFSARITARKP